jgi:hypothetical protein
MGRIVERIQMPVARRSLRTITWSSRPRRHLNGIDRASWQGRSTPQGSIERFLITFALALFHSASAIFSKVGYATYTMAMFVLLFSRLPGEFQSIDVVCASIENTDRLTGRHWIFDRIADLKTTLESAGVSEPDFSIPLQAAQLGAPSFLPITAEAATILGLLNPV